MEAPKGLQRVFQDTGETRTFSASRFLAGNGLEHDGLMASMVEAGVASALRMGLG